MNMINTFIEVHRGPVNNPTPVTINTAQIVEFSPCGEGTNLITTDDEYFVMESYKAIREVFIPGAKKADDTGARLRAREEFFKGK